MSVNNDLISNSQTLVTLHLAPKRYHEVARVCDGMKNRCFPGISFDPDRQAIHFKQSIESIHIHLQNALENFSAYKPIKGKPYEVTNNGIISAFSENKTRWEAHTAAADSLIRESEQFFTLRPDQNFSEEYQAWGTKMADFLGEVSRQPRIISRTSPEKEREVVAQLSSIQRLLAQNSVEQLHQLADRVSVERTPCEVDVHEMNIPIFKKDSNHELLKVKGFKAPLTNVHYHTGTEDEYLAYRLREQGSLTTKRLPRLQALNNEGLRVLNGRATLNKPLEKSMGDTQAARSVFRDLLALHRGVAFGEIHGESDVLRLLIENMKFFASRGVKVLFLEHLNAEMQAWLDRHAKQGTVMSKPLQETLQSSDKAHKRDSHYSLFDLVRAAKKAGIRVVGLETALTRHCSWLDKERSSKSIFAKNRCNTLNYMAMNIIQPILDEDRQAKYLIFAGGAHIFDIKGYAPGLASLLGIPCIGAGKRQKQNLNICAPEISRSFDVFFNPESEPVPPTRSATLSDLRSVKKKIHRVRTQLEHMKQLAAKTNKAARHRKNTVLTRLSHLESNLLALQQQKIAILHNIQSK